MNDPTMNRLWHAAVCCAVVLALAAGAAGVTVELKSGKKIVGDVVSKDDTNIVLKTKAVGKPGADGIVATNTQATKVAWRDVTTGTLKALHPDLYARLKAKADERAKKKAEEAKKAEDPMRAEGKVKFDGKWMTQEEAAKRKLSKIVLKLDVGEETVTADKHTDFSTSHSRSKGTTLKCWGQVVVVLDGLDPKDSHAVKVNVTHYRRSASGSSVYSINSGSSDLTDSIEKEQTVTGERVAKLIFKTSEYGREKSSYYSSYGGSSKYEYGYKSDGFDVSVSIDGTLVYEMKKGKAPTYYHVSGR